MTKFKFLLFFICIIPAGSFAQEHFYDFFKYGRNFGERNAAYYSNDNYMLLQGKHHTYGRELWVSDGTNQGTKLLKDCSTDPTAIFSDFASSGKLTSFNIYSKTDVQLWCTNGTTAGTKKLTESSYRYAGPTAFFKGWLFYLKVLNDDTFQIRRIDTTTFTMDSLVGNYAAPYDTRKSSFAVSDSFFYFNYDANLYRIDKSLGAPKLFWQKDPSLVRDIYSINIYKNVLVWCLNNSSGSETQIYSSTEKSGNVKLLTTVSDRCNILDLSGIGSVIFFTIGAYNSSIYFYKIETGTMSTSLVTSSVPFYMQHSDIEVFNNKLYFVARNANTFYSEIWSTNGTSAGTAMLKVIATDTMAIVSNLHAANGSLFFTAFTRKKWERTLVK
jgi:ELWxxDGT repeat protein